MKKKKIISIIVMVVGLIALVVGVVFLVINLNQAPAVQDGEYLVSAGEWALDEGANCAAESEVEAGAANCEPSVVWDFTEIGKGTLTTDGGEHDYDFIWALEDGKLLVETDWLYTLNNEYEYEIDQGAGVLTLTSGDEVYKFVANLAS